MCWAKLPSNKNIPHNLMLAKDPQIIPRFLSYTYKWEKDDALERMCTYKYTHGSQHQRSRAIFKCCVLVEYKIHIWLMTGDINDIFTLVITKGIQPYGDSIKSILIKLDALLQGHNLNIGKYENLLVIKPY